MSGLCFRTKMWSKASFGSLPVLKRSSCSSPGKHSPPAASTPSSQMAFFTAAASSFRAISKTSDRFFWLSRLACLTTSSLSWPPLSHSSFFRCFLASFRLAACRFSSSKRWFLCSSLNFSAATFSSCSRLRCSSIFSRSRASRCAISASRRGS